MIVELLSSLKEPIYWDGIKYFDSIYNHVTNVIRIDQKAKLEFIGAWHGASYRLISCIKSCQVINHSLKKFGDSPEIKERYNQDNELFIFYVTGLSMAECVFYGVYAIASMIKPEQFPMKSKNHLRNATAKNTVERYEKYFESENITLKMRAVFDSNKYEKWSNIRNILAHRASAGRFFEVCVGTNKNNRPLTRWKLWDGKAAEMPIIDNNTVESDLNWLLESLTDILQELHIFIDKYVLDSEDTVI